MKKKLIAKTQKLTPKLEEMESSFSSCIAIEPPEKEVVLKKGNVYTVFDVVSTNPLNVALISKVVNDVLFDSYYQSENISPVQSLEKAVVNINDKLFGLAAQEQVGEVVKQKKEKNLEFNIIVAVLWGNVLYVVQYGKGKSYSNKEGVTEMLPVTKEGNFSVNSGVVNAGDVLILCTESFAEKYPPNKLMDASIAVAEIENTESCMMLKLIVDTDLTEEEVVDFGVKKSGKTAKIPNVLSKLSIGKKTSTKKDQAIATLADTVEHVPNKNTLILDEKKENENNDIDAQPEHEAALPEINQEEEKTIETLPTSTFPEKINVKTQKEPKIKLRKSNSLRSKLKTKNISVIVLALLVVSLITTVLIRNNTGPNEEQQPQDQGTLTVPSEPENQESSQEQPQEIDPAIQAEEDERTSTQRVGAQPFYDIKLADGNAEPTELAIFNNSLVAVDKNSGRIFVSELETPKFVAEESTYPNISQVVNYDGSLGFSDGNSFKIYDLINKELTDTYEGTFGVTATYLGNLYTINGPTLVKYTVTASGATESDWGEDEGFEGAKDMDIAYNVYVLTKNNDLAVYSQGNRSNLSINGLEQPIGNAVSIDASNNFDFIYIADATNKRVVVLNDNGEFVKQLKAQNESDWEDIRSITVKSDESTMYLLSGSKVYEISLEE